ncbi:MAG: Aspartate-semialdehyde dehydrogenase, partial [Chlamydiia bacterium]|nr:Aspartate-semialdehyde dehydrogenase [Chlamydiia bacterium]
MLRDDAGSPPENYPESLIRDRSVETLHLRKKVPVAILGATGSVGQRLIQLLAHHPWFQIVALCASEKSQGKTYKEAVTWIQTTPLPEAIGLLPVLSCEPNFPYKIVFSGLSSSVAGDVETAFAKAGCVVISCAKNHRMDPDVPMLVPEVNIEHIDLVKEQKFPDGGMILTKPNCTVIGLALALKPLAVEFGIEALHVTTLNASSGAGFPGVPSLSLLDNLIPYIEDEEEKIETELSKVLGSYSHAIVQDYPLKISASCTRVPITEGHTEIVSVKLKRQATKEELIRIWREFSPPIQDLKLPMSPTHIIHYFDEKDLPQPKLQRDLERGMAV